MPDCPLSDECPSFTERIAGMGCQHYGDRGGKEWCNHYSQPIRDLKSSPVTLGEEVVVEVSDIHRSGAGVGRTDDGFIILVDGVLPEARARVKITKIRSSHALADEIERLPLEPEADDADDAAEPDGESADDETESEASADRRRPARERLGSRENFWGS